MSISKRILFASCLIVLVAITAHAQDRSAVRQTGTNPASVSAVTANPGHQLTNGAKTSAPVSKDLFHQKANELSQTLSHGSMDEADTKFMGVLTLMNNHLAYLEEKMDAASDKTNLETQMKNARDAYFAIISLHTNLLENKSALQGKLTEFEQTIR